MNFRSNKIYLVLRMVLAIFSFGSVVHAQVLPEDRADALYHSFDGGGVEITGPSILLRKQLTSNFSGYANYYVDSISSASIDVLSYASAYKEKRNEISVGGDYLLGETILSGGYTNSDEPDFEAQTAYFGVSQEIFGGLTTVTMGYAYGWDDVGRMIRLPTGEKISDPSFNEENDRRSYRLGLTQVISKRFIMSLDFEGITDEGGSLNNPYRQVRYRDGSPQGYNWQLEVYPETRTSSAFSFGGRYFLREGTAVYGSARIFDDTWGVKAWDAQMGYAFPFRDKWKLDLGYRYYSQTAADFYSDLFDYADQQNFLARDKELSTFNDHSLRFGVGYDLPVSRWDYIGRGTVTFNLDYMMFNYDDFRDVLGGGPVGEEPLYDFSATVMQLYISFWF